MARSPLSANGSEGTESLRVGPSPSPSDVERWRETNGRSVQPPPSDSSASSIARYDGDESSQLPSWLPGSPRASQPPPYVPSRRERALAWSMLVLGCVGVTIGVLVPGTHTEVVLGALLLVFGLRVLTFPRT